MADPDSPTNHLSSVDDEPQTLSHQQEIQEHDQQQESSVNNDWPW